MEQSKTPPLWCPCCRVDIEAEQVMDHFERLTMGIYQCKRVTRQERHLSVVPSSQT